MGERGQCVDKARPSIWEKIARICVSLPTEKIPYVAVKGKHAAHWSCAGRAEIFGKTWVR